MVDPNGASIPSPLPAPSTPFIDEEANAGISFFENCGMLSKINGSTWYLNDPVLFPKPTASPLSHNQCF